MAELYAMSPEDRQRYDEELKHYRDALNMLDTARERGRQEGRQEGLQDAVHRLIASGIPADQARRLPGLE